VAIANALQLEGCLMMPQSIWAVFVKFNQS